MPGAEVLGHGIIRWRALALAHAFRLMLPTACGEEGEPVWIAHCVRRSTRPHGRTPQHVEALIEAYAPLVKYIAHRLACRLPVSIGLEDLISTGVLGLLDAIQKYDPAAPQYV